MFEVWNKIKRKCIKLRLQPIRVLCFHQVSDVYNPLTMWDCDWTQTDQFKRNILHLRARGVTFISLPEAHDRLKHDWFRCKKYAVLTADDGYKSILSILPWLEEQQIPITLFINTKYLDKQSWSTINEEQARRVKQDVDMLSEVCPELYMSKNELFALTSPLISIGMHGHEHLDATNQTIDEFKRNVEQCRTIVQKHPRYMPFFAYTWGKHTKEATDILKEMNITPVVISGGKNYALSEYIDRIAIDGLTNEQINELMN